MIAPALLSRLACLATLVAFVSPVLAAADDEAIQFDSDFLESVLTPQRVGDAVGHLMAPATPGQTPPATGPHGADFNLVVDIAQFFIQYVNQLDQNHDQTYATIGDFRAYYTHVLPSQVNAALRHDAQLEIDALRTTATFQNSEAVTTTGVGAGLRMDFHPTVGGTLSASVLPLYGEKRGFSSVTRALPGGNDYIVRSSASVAYVRKFGEYVEPGLIVYFQPQVLDVGEFRVYAEAAIKFKVYSPDADSVKRLHVSEISLVPKVVYWHSTDRGGQFGDSIALELGNAYAQLSGDLYGMMNLEFHYSK